MPPLTLGEFGHLSGGQKPLERDQHLKQKHRAWHRTPGTERVLHGRRDKKLRRTQNTVKPCILSMSESLIAAA